MAPGGVRGRAPTRVHLIGPSRSCPRAKAPTLSSTPSTVQRTRTLAVVATIVCVPLLLLDLLWSSGSSAKVVSPAGADVTEVASPSSEPAPEAAPATSGPIVTAPVTAPVTGSRAPTPSATVARGAASWSAPAWSAPASSAPTTTMAPPPAPPPAPTAGSDAEFLACVRTRESGGDYAIVDRSGNYMGAYQFSQSTWDGIASRIGRADLVGRAPNTVPPADQDAIAWATLAISGRSPWGGLCD